MENARALHDEERNERLGQITGEGRIASLIVDNFHRATVLEKHEHRPWEVLSLAAIQPGSTGNRKSRFDREHGFLACELGLSIDRQWSRCRLLWVRCSTISREYEVSADR